ncbi:MAG: hypothetical protein KBF47_19510 [Gemmatimonadales bacterium]|nr:hypothetical protein [Gemmatimonadales bacterium]
MVAFQLAGKATRDALFLSTYSLDALPRMVMAAALLSALCTLGLSRVMARRGPARLVPRLFLLSGALLLLEWVLAVRLRPLAAVLFYLHYGALGALLISGFWALVTDRFDPRAAREHIAPITTGASVGGLLGGLVAIPLGSVLPLAGIFPLLALLHLGAAGLVRALRPPAGDPAAVAPGEAPAEALAAFRASGYLRLLAALVVLTALGEGLLDWVFKARVLAAAPGGGALLRTFALFYTATALLGILLQQTALRPAFARLGFARSAALLPAGVAAGALGGMLVPGVVPLLLARGAEIVLRHSFFRSAYELLFTPVPPAEKRATKLLVDVGATRLGDLAGGALIQAMILLAGAAAGGWVLGATIAIALVTLGVARRLQLGYTTALARSLSLRADHLGPEAADDTTALLQTMGGFDLAPLRAPRAAAPVPAAGADAPAVAQPRAAALASRDPQAVIAALESGPLPPALLGAAADLLAWDAVAPAAIRALAQVAPAAAPVLLPRMLDPAEDFAIRRRLVRVLAESPTPEVFAALHQALADRRFEVRYLVGRALYRQAAERADLRVDREWICDAVLTEVTVGRGVWESRRLIDAADDAASPMETALLRDRADRSLEHVFTLLALILPREPLRLAYHGLHTADRHLRGTALEYLESALPPAVRAGLWPFLEPEGREMEGGARGPDADAALSRLLQSRESIVLALAELRERQGGADADGPGRP